MNVAITAESTIDLPKNLLSEWEIATVPFTVTMGDKTGLDGEISSEESFEYTRRTGKLPKTSAVNQFQYEEFFREQLKPHEHVIHFALSSGISSAFVNATAVSKEPEFLGKVDVIDTLSLSTGIALQAIYARKLARAGKSVEEIVSLAKARIPGCQASFSLERVNNLYKGGRCSALAMMGANLLKLKPEIFVENGKMIAGKKYRGSMKTVVDAYVKDTLEKFNTPDHSLVFITYSSAPDEVVEGVRETLKKAGFQRIEATRAGATISVYCGEHTLGILYFNDGEHRI